MSPGQFSYLLIIAARGGCINILQYLKDEHYGRNGLDARLPDICLKLTPLYVACSVWVGCTVVSLLLDMGARTDIASEDFLEYLLHYAAGTGNVDLVKMLLKHVAEHDPDASVRRNRIGLTAVETAKRFSVELRQSPFLKNKAASLKSLVNLTTVGELLEDFMRDHGQLWTHKQHHMYLNRSVAFENVQAQSHQLSSPPPQPLRLPRPPNPASQTGPCLPARHCPVLYIPAGTCNSIYGSSNDDGSPGRSSKTKQCLKRWPSTSAPLCYLMQQASEVQFLRAPVKSEGYLTVLRRSISHLHIRILSLKASALSSLALEDSCTVTLLDIERHQIIARDQLGSGGGCDGWYESPS